MTVYALTSVDLHDADSKQRARFDEAMAKEKWRKLGDVTTTYRGMWTERITHSRAIVISKLEVRAAAESARIADWNAIVMVSETDMEEF